jgi:DNA replicative helicase MCM subunit Mcm2 (Cdc46/Mcm family)
MGGAQQSLPAAHGDEWPGACHLGACSCSRPRPPPRYLQPEGLELLPPSLLRAYISLARRHEPHVPQELSEYICGAYVALRQRERWVWGPGALVEPGNRQRCVHAIPGRRAP